MKPCLILGNGPSFNEMPAGVLESMPSFGMNYCGFQPTFYVCIDDDILRNHVEEIYPIAAAAEISYLSGLHEGTSKLYELPYVRLVTKDTQSFRDEQYLSGFTATYVALKLAYYAGFGEVYLWGVDHSPDWKHYKGDYPAGHTTAARMRVMEAHYRLAANIYARAGRTIINHSHPSKLDSIFRRA